MENFYLKTFRFELLLDKIQENLSNQTEGCCRYIWNTFLGYKKDVWEKNKEKISRFDLDKKLTDLKCEKDWLNIPPSQTLQQVNKDLDQAFKNFFNGFGYPNFKKKGRKNGFRIPQGIFLKNSLSKRIGQIQLPKFGIVKFIQTRKIKGEIRYVTISKEADKRFISITCRVPKKIPPVKKNVLAIDRGIKIFASCSDKTEIPSISVLSKNLKKLKNLQRKLKKKKKFSSNWKKTIKKLQKAHIHIKNKRRW